MGFCFIFKNSHKNLDTSGKMALDFEDCFGGINSVLQQHEYSALEHDVKWQAKLQQMMLLLILLLSYLENEA